MKKLKTLDELCELFPEVVNDRATRQFNIFQQIKFKKLNEKAVVPTYSKKGDAGLDLTAISYKHDYLEGSFIYGTGLSFEIPQGYVGLIFPRSSIAKKDFILSNHVGVIDSSYRGEVFFKFKAYDKKNVGPMYVTGDRIGQLLIIPYPQIELIEVNELSNTERGSGGFGSTGE